MFQVRRRISRSIPLTHSWKSLETMWTKNEHYVEPYFSRWDWKFPLVKSNIVKLSAYMVRTVHNIRTYETTRLLFRVCFTACLGYVHSAQQKQKINPTTGSPRPLGNYPRQLIMHKNIMRHETILVKTILMISLRQINPYNWRSMLYEMRYYPETIFFWFLKNILREVFIPERETLPYTTGRRTSNRYFYKNMIGIQNTWSIPLNRVELLSDKLLQISKTPVSMHSINPARKISKMYVLINWVVLSEMVSTIFKKCIIYTDMATPGTNYSPARIDTASDSMTMCVINTGGGNVVCAVYFNA